MRVCIDGETVEVQAGATIMDACDAAGRYVSRLCYYPGLGCAGCGPATAEGTAAVAAAECGLCAVELSDGSTVPACSTAVVPGMDVITDSPPLRAERLERLGSILAGHPGVCLACPDAEGCSRDECTYGNPPESRCCGEFGRCELGKLVAWIGAAASLPRRPVTVDREAITEGRIQREPGLCVGCGRCVRACATLDGAGNVLELRDGGLGGSAVVHPKNGTLRSSGCTFCGQCVLVCPAGALTAPGERGAVWLEGRRERSLLRDPVLPPVDRKQFTLETVRAVPAAPGVFQLQDRDGATLLIKGAADLRSALLDALDDASWAAACQFTIDFDPMFTQRESELLARYAQEHGGLPAGNDLDDDLF